MAAWTRLAVLASVAVLALAGCTYSTDEPGLFPSPQPRTQAPSPTRSGFPPQETNPKLPVAGERIWVSGGQVPVTMRIAVHAVRRVEGATVLDWSITPLSAEGLEFGDDLPGIELGLDRPARGNHEPAVSLLDAEAGRVYRALTHDSRQSNHCLCTPLWYMAQQMRIGETRLLQVAFPPLARRDRLRRGQHGHGDSRSSTSRSVPSGLHRWPAGRPISPARPSGRKPFPSRSSSTTRSSPGSVQRIQVNRVWAAPGRTTLEWTLSSVTDQNSNRILEYGPPVAARRPAGVLPGECESSQRTGPRRADPRTARSD